MRLSKMIRSGEYKISNKLLITYWYLLLPYNLTLMVFPLLLLRFIIGLDVHASTFVGVVMGIILIMKAGIVPIPEQEYIEIK